MILSAGEYIAGSITSIHTTKGDIPSNVAYDAVAAAVGAEEHRVPGRRLGQLLQALENTTHKSCAIDNVNAQDHCQWYKTCEFHSPEVAAAVQAIDNGTAACSCDPCIIWQG